MPRPLGSATMAGPQKPLLQSRKPRRAGSPGSRHASPAPTTSARIPLQAAVSCEDGGQGSGPSGPTLPPARPAPRPPQACSRSRARTPFRSFHGISAARPPAVCGSPDCWDLREGRDGVAVRGSDRIGAVEFRGHIGTADASPAGPDERFGALRFANATGGSDLGNVAAGENGHAASIEASGHGALGTVHEGVIETLDPLRLREIRIIPRGLDPSPGAATASTARPPSHKPTDHFRVPAIPDRSCSGSDIHGHEGCREVRSMCPSPHCSGSTPRRGYRRRGSVSQVSREISCRSTSRPPPRSFWPADVMPTLRSTRADAAFAGLVVATIL